MEALWGRTVGPWFVVMEWRVFCFALTLLATGYQPSAQEQENPEVEWTVVSEIAEPDEDPVKVILEDLWARPAFYHERLVLVQGALHVSRPAAADPIEETFELRKGRVAVPLLVDPAAPGPEARAVLASFNGVAVEVLGRFINMAPAEDRVEMLTDIDSIYVDSLRRLEGANLDEEAATAAQPESSAGTALSGKPPRVISSNPRPGERGVPLATKIVLRFSEDMDEGSFEGNVRLHYAGESELEDSFPNLSMFYNPDTASLVIDPGQKLERKSELHLFLKKGVVSEEGVPMLRNTPSSRRQSGIRSRRSTPADLQGEDVVVVLIFYTL